MKYKRCCFGKTITSNVEYYYDGNFEENILTVGQTGCWKRTFVQKLAKNGTFDDIKEIYWVSKICLSLEIEKNISDCFKKHVEFRYPNSLENITACLDFFQRKREETSCWAYCYGRRLGLCWQIWNFLTVSRKFSFTCTYVFHTIYPTRSNWQIIPSQTKIFNIFLALYKPRL